MPRGRRARSSASPTGLSLPAHPQVRASPVSVAFERSAMVRVSQAILGRRMRLVQVLPALPPARDGIGDYAVLLAEGLAERGVESTFLTYEPGGESGIVAGRFERDVVPGRSGDALAACLERVTPDDRTPVVLLHYDPVRVTPRQIPGWMVAGIRRWKRRGSRRRLVVTFHELTPDYHERRLDLVLRPLQRHVTVRLLGLADLAICSVPGVAGRLSALRPDLPIRLVTVFSNLGEPLPPAVEVPRDPRRWIALGSTWRLINSLETLAGALPGIPAWCSPAHLAVVGGGGAGEERLDRILKGLPSGLFVSRHPDVPAEEASRHLLSSAFCIQRILRGDHPFDPPLLFKSGVFAAAAAHGVVTVLTDRSVSRAPEGNDLPRFVTPASADYPFPEPGEMAALPSSLNRWYHAHASRARAIAEYEQGLLQVEAGP